jgi:hypothetical protein
MVHASAPVGAFTGTATGLLVSCAPSDCPVKPEDASPLGSPAVTTSAIAARHTAGSPPGLGAAERCERRPDSAAGRSDPAC